MTTEVRSRCAECNGRCVRDGDELVCRQCGLVNDADRIDRGPEWRAIDEADRTRKRTGAPLTRARHDRGLSTEMGPIRSTGRRRQRLRRLRRQHDRTCIRTKSERNRVWAFTEIRRLADVLGVPTAIRDRACVLFGRAQDADLLRGRSVEGVAAACVYVACRQARVTRTVVEVARHAKADRDELRVAYAALNRGLDLPIRPVDPRELIPRFASGLDVPAAVEQRAMEFARTVREEDIDGGRDPAGVASACLYAAAQAENYPLTQADAADEADVTPVTLRTTYHDLRAASTAL